jgi:hypothetical protein
MSTISVSNIVTANGSEPLTLATGNTSAGDIIIGATGGVVIASNSTVNTITANATGAHFVGNVAIGGITTLSGNLVLGSSALSANGGVGTAGQLLTSNGTAAYWSTVNSGPVAATQAEQEAASSTTTYVSPGRQHFHPSAAKFWAHFGTSGNLLAGYNVTSITDGGAGNATVVIAIDFGTSDYCVGVSAENLDATIDSIADGQMQMIALGGQAAGSVQVINKNDDGTAAADPTTWNVWGFGDLA